MRLTEININSLRQTILLVMADISWILFALIKISFVSVQMVVGVSE